MDLGENLGHLTYCTNIHAGEAWPDVAASLRTHLPAIKQGVAPDRPLGVGLRIAGSAAEALQDPAAMAELRALLDDGGYYVFTLNGFPYGTFHGKRVKEEAYLPDWSEEVRLAYTDRLADLLAEILPEGQQGSVSTVPGTYRPWGEGRVEAIARNLIRHVAHLVALRERTGKTIALALEPEPRCLLETVAETVAFFEAQLFSDGAISQLVELSGLARGDAEEALRRHLGVCYDVCHAAVEFEDPRKSVAVLRGAGIAISKLQLSAALKIEGVQEATKDQLRAFDEPVYLHQLVERRNGTLIRYLDLPEALAAPTPELGAEWRVHFHVPIFLDALKDFGTTQDFLREILALHREEPISQHLEVETYTWDVLPERYRSAGIAEAIARELRWAKDCLGA